MKRPEGLRVGARTLKTALAVFICLLLDLFIPFSSGIYSCVAAVICMMSTAKDTLRAGLNRVVATVFACLAGLGILLLASLMPGTYRVVRIFLIPLVVILLILLCNVVHRQAAAALSCAVFIILALGPEMTVDAAVLYAITRFFETVLGIVVAFLVNRFIHPPRDEENTPSG